MSVFLTHANRKPRPAVILGLSALFMAVGAIGLANIDRGSRTASQLDAFGEIAPQPQATTFVEPTPVAWEGRILRMLAGGQGAGSPCAEAYEAP